MKKLLFYLILFLFVPYIALAAGTVTVTKHYSSVDNKVLVIKLACVGDSGDGSVPETVIQPADVGKLLFNGEYRNYEEIGYSFYELWVEIGTTAPDAADITIWDVSNLAQIYDEDNVIPTSGTKEGSIDKYRTITHPMKFGVQNQATVSADWNVYIKLVK